MGAGVTAPDVVGPDEVGPDEVGTDLVGSPALRRWLRARGVGDAIERAVRLTGGTQNLVYRVTVGGRDLVLRRGPQHLRPGSNRTIAREIRVLTGLAATDVPHPRLVAGCPDPDVIGAAFYLMDAVDGVNPAEGMSAQQEASASLRHDSALAVARTVGRLGAVDVSAAGLAGLRRPGSFLARQVPQWREHLAGYRRFPRWSPGGLPDVEPLAAWLDANRPDDAPPGIVHGDCHLNNVLLAPAEPRVAALIDWEMSTVGDPLLDLGWLMITWQRDPVVVANGGPFARAGGLPSRAAMVEAYRRAGGRSPDRIDWYTALAGYKLGIVLEGTHARATAGLAPVATGDRLHARAVRLLTAATRIARGEWDGVSELAGPYRWSPDHCGTE